MNINALKTELDTDPLTRGYSGMTAEEAADSLNTVNRTKPQSVSSAEAQAAVVATEYLALADALRDLWLAILTTGTIDVNNANIVAQVREVWDVGTTTRTNLAALATRAVSRAEEIGLPRVKPGHVEEARRL